MKPVGNKGNLLIVFAKRPLKGFVKTRLASSIGDEAALIIYKKLLSDTLHLAMSDLWTTKVFWDDIPCKTSLEINQFSYEYEIQKGENLGERMSNAHKLAFESGFEKSIIIGADIAGIMPSYLEKAFHKLSEFPMVIGPAEDGGYWLIGEAKFEPKIFTGIRWSSEYVFSDTISIANATNLKFTLVEKLNDIDTLEDLEKWRPDWKNLVNKTSI